MHYSFQPKLRLRLMALSILAVVTSNARLEAQSLWDRLCGQCEPRGTIHYRASDSFAGEWHWMRSPDQEKRVVVALYNRYCVRCHGVDGKGVWDMPDVPDFTNPRWQQCRSDDQLVRLTLEGRGACMPAFRGTLSYEETWAMTRYLRTFGMVPMSEIIEPNKKPSETKDSEKEEDKKTEKDKDKESSDKAAESEIARKFQNAGSSNSPLKSARIPVVPSRLPARR